MMRGILLALQFFTIMPINQQLEMDRKSVTAMFSTLPWIGGLIGLVTASIWLFIDASPLFLAFTIVLIGIVMSGGLHLDGFVDTSDAYFSYRDQHKRHEILADPRIGAFGAMALLLFVIGKIVLLTEIITQGGMKWEWLLILPFLARAGMVYYFTLTQAARDKGLASFFKKRINHRILLVMTILSLAVGAGFIMLVGGEMVLAISSLLVLFSCAYAFKYWTKKHFGGVTGDVSGAFVEGMEVGLWLLIFILL
ncbi:adenosylcobinamide-GDP ribazoletransferase [Paenisporosarcina sp. TG20]|uniref:adenosylcobinamide-GDP ribazoletransferase n=1 Tax=Paenisporosarcina sp. TG20 TaxID=1211706 RepID=UPI00035CA34C|nr:adenosylcobinamide-GDP ribazoletransferase [Paenisporosarcina sp. TG20]